MKAPVLFRFIVFAVSAFPAGFVASPVAAQQSAATAGNPGMVFPIGEQLGKFLDGLDVEHHWLAHNRVDWETGAAVEPSSDPVHSTHCSAFVAAACERLGVPMLHPPEHALKLLASAQCDWLKAEGLSQGWRQLATPHEAQVLANRGHLVLAVFKNPQPDKPGHIAIVRPALKNPDQLAAEGPDIIQAGAHNYNRTNARSGFAHHPGAFEMGKILYFEHPIDFAKASLVAPTPMPSAMPEATATPDAGAPAAPVSPMPDESPAASHVTPPTASAAPTDTPAG